MRSAAQAPEAVTMSCPDGYAVRMQCAACVAAHVEALGLRGRMLALCAAPDHGGDVARLTIRVRPSPSSSSRATDCRTFLLRQKSTDNMHELRFLAAGAPAEEQTPAPTPAPMSAQTPVPVQVLRVQYLSCTCPPYRRSSLALPLPVWALCLTYMNTQGDVVQLLAARCQRSQTSVPHRCLGP